MASAYTFPTLDLQPVRITQLSLYPTTLLSLNDILPVVQMSTVTTTKATILQIRSTVLKDIDVPTLTSTFISNNAMQTGSVEAENIRISGGTTPLLRVNTNTVSYTYPLNIQSIAQGVGSAFTLSPYINVKPDSYFKVGIVIDSQDASPFIVNSYSSSDDRNVIRGYTARGTITSPTAVQADDTIFALRGFSHYGGSTGQYHGAGLGGQADISFCASGNQTTSNAGSYITFSTQRENTVTENIKERVRITDEGYVGIGTSTPLRSLVVAGDSGEGSDVYIQANHEDTYFGTAGPALIFGLKRNVSSGLYAKTNDVLGVISGRGHSTDSTVSTDGEGNANAAYISFRASGDFNSKSTTGGYISFYTADAGVLGQAVKITNDKKLYVYGDIVLSGKVDGDLNRVYEFTYTTGVSDYTVTHNLNNRNLIIQVYETYTDHIEIVLVGVKSYDNSIVVSMSSGINGKIYRVIVQK